jgi:hypothetical protein
VVRAVWTAASILGLSPLMPVVAVAALMPATVTEPPAKLRKNGCDQLCAVRRLATMPRQTILTGIDLGPSLIARTPHRFYGAGYHRLEQPLHDMIVFFQGPSETGEAFMRDKGLTSIIIDPTSEETKLFIKTAPSGMMARLAKGPTPDWLVEQDLGSNALRLYRVRNVR